MCCFFFFSSRRRHTRFDCDWSSDVCSSDLQGRGRPESLRVGPAFCRRASLQGPRVLGREHAGPARGTGRSEEHTSELQSQSNLVCRLLLEKKKNASQNYTKVSKIVH